MLLEVRDLKKYYPVTRGALKKAAGTVKAIDGVSFGIDTNETVGLVGESGCGKTTLAKVILGLIRPSEGEIIFDGRDIFKLPHRALQNLRCEFQIIFQDPFNSLNPRMRVRDIVSEPLAVHNLAGRRELAGRSKDLLISVGLPPESARRYPHEFSGGERQRIGIARAIATKPKLIICDEPVSSLDVKTQEQMLNLLARLQKEIGVSYLFIAHNLNLARRVCNRIIVMYLGKIMEIADAGSLFNEPLHPYTEALIDAASIGDRKRGRIVARGELPSPMDIPKGCRYNTRCHRAIDKCYEIEPELLEKRPGHFSACHVLV